MLPTGSRTLAGAGLILLFLLLAAGCAPRGKPPAPAENPPPSGVELRLEHLTGEDAWLLTYKLPRPLRAARFLRGKYAFRRSSWQVVSPGLKLDRMNGDDVVVSTDGRPFEQLVLKIPTYHRKPEKDYQVFIPYTDGGVLVYTGQFNLSPLSCRAPERCEAKEIEAKEPESKTTFTLVPRGSEQLVLLGQVHQGEARWSGSEQGTYAYFGRTKSVVTEDVIAVVDPGMPRWLLDQTNDLIPKLFAFYGARTGHRLNFKPVVFMSYGEQASPTSISIGGGTLPGLLQMEVRLGKSYQREADPEVAERNAHNVAHEAAHLWNGQLFDHKVEGGAWLHEGGAEAFAYRALVALGRITRERYLEIESESLSKCLLGLDGAPVKDSSKPGRTKNYYWCGSVIALLTEAAGRRASPPVDIFTFWGRLFSSSKQNLYDDKLYFQAVESLPDGPRALKTIRRLVEGPVQDLDRQLVDDLTALGVRTSVSSKPPPLEYQQLLGSRAAMAPRPPYLEIHAGE